MTVKICMVEDLYYEIWENQKLVYEGKDIELSKDEEVWVKKVLSEYEQVQKFLEKKFND